MYGNVCYMLISYTRWCIIGVGLVVVRSNREGNARA